MIEPHGGRLVDRVAAEETGESLGNSTDEVSIALDEPTFQDVINISNGRYSPLTGFMGQRDFLKVIEDVALEDGTVWPLPIVLDVDSETAASLAPGTRAGLVSPAGEEIGLLDVAEVYTYDDETAARKIFGTDERAHPGVRSFRAMGEFLVGGDVTLFEEIRLHEADLFPTETRVLFEHNGWTEVAGFQTRNAPHRAHEYIQKASLELVDGLLVQPKLGDKKPNDYRDDVIVDTYRLLVENYYPTENVVISAFPSSMRYAGPREAVFDSIIRKNQGCTHFIVGRDHAGVGDYYDEMAARQFFDTMPDIGIDLLFYDDAFYCHRCDGMASRKTCCHDDSDRVIPSGSRIRDLIRNHEQPFDKLMRPEVATYVVEADSPFIDADMEGDV